MRIATLIVILLGHAYFAPHALAQSQSDEELRRLIVGTWVPSVGDTTSVPAKSTYRQDGILEFVSYSDLSCTRATLRALAQWKIEDGRLIVRVLESSDPTSVVRAGVVVVDQIVSISSSEAILRNDSGTIQRRARSSVCLNGRTA